MTAWRAALPLPRELAAAADAVFEAHLTTGHPPSLASFAREDNRNIYIVQAYFDAKPNEQVLREALTLALGEEISSNLVVEMLPDTDWVSLSQSMLPPVTAGRFHVYGAHAADTLQDNQIGLWVEAGQAFGTGSHETTEGCLLTLDSLQKQFKISHALDVGTGSGVLALAIAKAWQVTVVMSDIDPIATKTAVENATANDVHILETLGGAGVLAVTADGIHDEKIEKFAPYPLIIANILAQPLCDMAQGITALMAAHGKIILSGLLSKQASPVLAAYEQFGWVEEKRVSVGDWPTLTLVKR